MQKPPPYSEKSVKASEPLALPARPALPRGYGVPAPVPQQYQPYYGPPGAGFSQGPILHPPQTIFITSIPYVNEPDYLAYSIFTMFCCCLPIGIAAVIYSIKTRNANKTGNGTAAQQYSQMARSLAHTALAVGLVITILGIILRIVLGNTARRRYNQHNP